MPTSTTMSCVLVISTLFLLHTPHRNSIRSTGTAPVFHGETNVSEAVLSKRVELWLQEDNGSDSNAHLGIPIDIGMPANPLEDIELEYLPRHYYHLYLWTYMLCHLEEEHEFGDIASTASVKNDQLSKSN